MTHVWTYIYETQACHMCYTCVFQRMCTCVTFSSQTHVTHVFRMGHMRGICAFVYKYVFLNGFTILDNQKAISVLTLFRNAYCTDYSTKLVTKQFIDNFSKIHVKLFV